MTACAVVRPGPGPATWSLFPLEVSLAGGWDWLQRGLVVGWGRSGRRAGGLVNGEFIGGEPAVHGWLERPGLDNRGVPGLADRCAQVPGAFVRFAIPLTPRAAAGGLGGQERARDRGVAVVLSAGL